MFLMPCLINSSCLFQMIDSQLELAGKIPAKGVAGGQFDMENEKF